MESSKSTSKTGIRLAVAGAIVIAAAVVVFFLVKDKNSGDSGSSAARAASAEELRSVANDAGHPVYWAGPRPGFTYELTKTASGRIFIRYLPPGAEVGDPRPDFLSVATYPYENAYATLRKLAKREGSVSRTVDGGIAVSPATRPESVYIAYPGLNLEIEVYDPSAKRARRVAFSGKVTPIE